MNDVDFIVRAKLLSLNSRHVGPSVRNGPRRQNRIEWPDEQRELKNLQPKAGLFTKRHSYKWVAPEVPPHDGLPLGMGGTVGYSAAPLATLVPLSFEAVAAECDFGAT